MKSLISSMSTLGKYLPVHLFALSCVLTGIVMLLTAVDLGPMGPLVIAFGIYAIFFGSMIETLFAVRHLFCFVAKRILVHVN